MFSIYPDFPLNCITQLNLVFWCCIAYIFLFVLYYTVYLVILVLYRISKEMFEDTKEDRKQNGQSKNDKRTNNDKQNITQKTKYRVTGILLKAEGNLG